MRTALSGRTRTGLVIAGLLGLSDVLSILQPTPDGENGPPFSVLAVGLVLGLVTLAALVPAWRTGNRKALRAVAGSRIVSAILALPAFFVDIPPALMVFASVAVALTVVSVVLILAPAGRPVPVTD